MHILRKYGVAVGIYFPLITTGSDDFKNAPTIEAGDIMISQDLGVNWTEPATLPAVTATGSKIVKVLFSNTENDCAVIFVRVIDQSSPKEWKDDFYVVDTYGNASAQHKFDLDEPSHYGTTRRG
jgi:hypothetical protein